MFVDVVVDALLMFVLSCIAVVYQTVVLYHISCVLLLSEISENVTNVHTFVDVNQSERSQTDNDQQPAAAYNTNLAGNEFRRLCSSRTQRALSGDWTSVFALLFNEVWDRCALSFKDNRFRRSCRRQSTTPYWQCRAYCRHNPECIKVKMAIRDQPLNDAQRIPVEIVISGRCTHANGQDENSNVRLLPNRRQLSGDRRRQTVTMLRNTGQSVTEYHYARLGSMTEAECLAGHTTACQTPGVLRHAVYQDRRREQLHLDMIMELQILKSSFVASLPENKLSGYIHSIGLDPFHVLMFLQRQIQIYIEACKRKNDCTVHIDATGSIMRNIPGQKRPLYYCLLLSEETSLPVCDFITTRHTSEAIQSRLLTFNHYVSIVNNNKLVKPTFIVTDMPYALINACVRSFNDESLSRFLHRCYRYLMIRSTLDVISNTTFIVICYSHMIKTVLRRLTVVEPSLYKRKLVLLLFTALTKTRCLATASAMYDNIHVALCSRRNVNAVATVKQQLTGLVTTVDDNLLMQGYNVEQQQVIDEISEDELCTVDLLSTLKNNSPFTQFFCDSLITPVSDENEEEPDNDWFSDNGFSTITEYMHLYPLWSAALQHQPTRLASDYRGDRQCQQAVTRSNAAIESHFRAVKHGRLGGRRSVRPKEFIDAQLTYIKGKLNECLLPSKRRATSNQLADLEEGWSRRPRQSRRGSRIATYSDAITARNIITAVERRGNSRYRGRARGRGRARELMTRPVATSELRQTPSSPEQGNTTYVMSAIPTSTTAPLTFVASAETTFTASQHTRARING